MNAKTINQDSVTDARRWAGNSFLLDSLFEQSPLELFVVDEKFQIVKASKYLAHKMCAQPVARLLGKSMSWVVGESAWKTVRPLFTDALRGTYAHDAHITLTQTSQLGAKRHYLLTIYPLPSIEDGKLFGGMFQEITRQFDDEAELIRYQNRLEMTKDAGGIGLLEWSFENNELNERLQFERWRLLKLFENVPCIVFESRGDIEVGGFEMLFINSFAEKMLGYPVEKWLSVPNFAQSIIHPEDKERVLSEAQRAVDTQTVGLNRYRWRHKSGSYIWCEAQFSPIVVHGKVKGLRGVVTDISERMVFEERKDDFIAAASHELKTPLTSLKVFTQVLAASNHIQLNPKSLKYVNRMEKEVDRLTKLVFDLLDLSKIQRGELPLTKQEMSLSNLLIEIIENLQPTIPQKIEFSEKKSVVIDADKQRLNQVFTNLISNAAKYSPDTSTIHIIMTQKEHSIVVGVRDKGVGIAPKYQELVFQRFYRVLDETDKTFPGLGMGLFISKSIVEHHDGKIWLESEPQKGTTFFVCLPINARERSEK